MPGFLIDQLSLCLVLPGVLSSISRDHRYLVITEDAKKTQLLSVLRLEQFESNLFSSINIILINFILNLRYYYYLSIDHFEIYRKFFKNTCNYVLQIKLISSIK